MVQHRGAGRAMARRRPDALLAGARGRGNEASARAAAARRTSAGEVRGSVHRASALPALDVVLGAFLAVLTRGHHREAALGAGRKVLAAEHLVGVAPRILDVLAVHVLR